MTEIRLFHFFLDGTTRLTRKLWRKKSCFKRVPCILKGTRIKERRQRKIRTQTNTTLKKVGFHFKDTTPRSNGGRWKKEGREGREIKTKRERREKQVRRDEDDRFRNQIFWSVRFLRPRGDVVVLLFQCFYVCDANVYSFAYLTHFFDDSSTIKVFPCFSFLFSLKKKKTSKKIKKKMGNCSWLLIFFLLDFELCKKLSHFLFNPFFDVDDGYLEYQKW